MGQFLYRNGKDSLLSFNEQSKMSSDRAVGGNAQNAQITILFLHDFYKGYFAVNCLKVHFLGFSKIS